MVQDINSLISQLEILCSNETGDEYLITANHNKIMKCINDIYSSLQQFDINQQNLILQRVDLIMSCHQYSSILSYSLLQRYPGLFGTISRTNSLITSMRLSERSEYILNILFDKKIDNSLSDSINRWISYIENIFYEIFYKIVDVRRYEVIENILVALATRMNIEDIRFIVYSLQADYEYDVLSTFDYDSILFNMDFITKSADNCMELKDKLDEILMKGSDAVLKYCSLLLHNSNEIDRRIINNTLSSLGNQFVQAVAQYNVVDLNTCNEISSSYRTEVFEYGISSFLYAFENTVIKESRCVVLNSSYNMDRKCACFKTLLGMFEIICKYGRILNEYDNQK